MSEYIIPDCDAFEASPFMLNKSYQNYVRETLKISCETHKGYALDVERLFPKFVNFAVSGGPYSEQMKLKFGVEDTIYGQPLELLGL